MLLTPNLAIIRTGNMIIRNAWPSYAWNWNHQPDKDGIKVIWRPPVSYPPQHHYDGYTAAETKD